MILLYAREVRRICDILWTEEYWQVVTGSALGTTLGVSMLAYEPGENSSRKLLNVFSLLAGVPSLISSVVAYPFCP
ncbi:hypothetical protein RA279_28430, partial [Pseudomonas syringae pv. tagetis]|uniref:hypothetical protein n=1 Tax=Pseudomonas syringae group genomosp. 7 TaxID=251699 RepID=UPI00377029D1